MQLLPWCEKRLAEAEARQPVIERGRCTFPRTIEYYARKPNLVGGEPTARAMVEFAQQRPIAFAGVSVQFRHKRPPVDLENGRIWTDPKSIEPLLLAVSFVETDGQGDLICPFVCDLRQPAVVTALSTILRIPVPFVGHGLNDLLFSIWQLGLRAPDQLWDTCLQTFVSLHALNAKPSLGGYLYALAHHNLSGLGRLAQADQKRFQGSIVNRRNTYMHGAGLAPANESEVQTILSEMDDCLRLVLSL